MNKLPQDIILEPIISEKGTLLLGENKYVLKVPLKATKVEIRKAVEELFKVEVREVRTMRVKGKRRKWRGRVVGRTSDWKKAIVKLREGSTIEELGV